jgi:hypothetical protein
MCAMTARTDAYEVDPRYYEDLGHKMDWICITAGTPGTFHTISNS